MRFLAREWLWIVGTTIVGTVAGMAGGLDAVTAGAIAFFVWYPGLAVLRITIWAIRTVVRSAPRDSAIGAARDAAAASWRDSAPVD